MRTSRWSAWCSMAGMVLAAAVAGPVRAGDGAETEVLWRQRFSLHLSGSSGNTDSWDTRSAWRARRETSRTRQFVDAGYSIGATDGSVTRSALTSGARQDWLMPGSSWFGFGEGRYDFDNFRAWRHRAASHWGLGNMIRKTETLELIGRIGAGASKQWERTDDLRPEGLLGAELTWSITGSSELTASSYLYPELDDMSQLRAVTRAELSVALDYARGMSIVSGIEHDYETSAGTEARNWDFRYYTGLSIAF